MPKEAELHNGPYLVMAVFCDKVLQENNGVLSVIRVVDRLNVSDGFQSGARRRDIQRANLHDKQSNSDLDFFITRQRHSWRFRLFVDSPRIGLRLRLEGAVERKRSNYDFYQCHSVECRDIRGGHRRSGHSSGDCL